MKISVLCNDGSPIGVTSQSIWGDEHQIGIGGAELALLTMCEAWAKDHEVILYNSPRVPNASLFEQRSILAFDSSDNSDVVIIFRSPNVKAIPVKGKKVWWSTDQFTVGNYSEFSAFVDEIVCISPFHKNFFRYTYGINKVHVIDLPVRQSDYDDKDIEKVPYRMIFTSIPDRGLSNLERMWRPLRMAIPDISLVITSDYRLWGVGSPNNERYRVRWLAQEGSFNFLGAINRSKLIEEQLKAEIMLYPCNYDELFCIAVAEAQYASVYPITSAQGALETTNMGTVLAVDTNDPRNDVSFRNAVIELFSDRTKLLKKQKEVHKAAKERFSIEKILKEWEKVFE